MGPWTAHGSQTGGYYKCNKYNPKAAKKEAEEGKVSAEDGKDTSAAKQELDRYLHYYQRYHNHDQAKQWASKQYAMTEQRMQVKNRSIVESVRNDHSWVKV